MSLNHDQLKKVIKLLLREDGGYCCIERIQIAIQKNFPGISDEQIAGAADDLQGNCEIKAQYFYYL